MVSMGAFVGAAAAAWWLPESRVSGRAACDALAGARPEPCHAGATPCWPLLSRDWAGLLIAAGRGGPVLAVGELAPAVARR
jgi:hypothetical protein